MLIEHSFKICKNNTRGRNGYSLFFCRGGNTKGDEDGVEAVVERVFIST
jgi:hypothetical protein